MGEKKWDSKYFTSEGFVTDFLTNNSLLPIDVGSITRDEKGGFTVFYYA